MTALQDEVSGIVTGTVFILTDEQLQIRIDTLAELAGYQEEIYDDTGVLIPNPQSKTYAAIVHWLSMADSAVIERESRLAATNASEAKTLEVSELLKIPTP